MTSTLMARLVESGQLRWDSTLGEVFPDFAPRMNPDFRSVTLLELLSHHAGLPANLDLAKYSGDDAPQLRRRAVQTELAKKPVSPPGARTLIQILAIFWPRPWPSKPPASPGKFLSLTKFSNLCTCSPPVLGAPARRAKLTSLGPIRQMAPDQ